MVMDLKQEHLNLNDSFNVQKLQLTIPQLKGNRKFNHYTESFSVMELAELIKDSLGGK